ncbi:alpha/beta hydrolase family protein [Streptomyces goshikiensis]
MTLFKDPGYNFNGLLALGASGAGAAEVGEVLTAVNAINGAGLSAQTYVETFRKLGDQLLGPPPGSPADAQTKRFRALRAAQYYGQALFFVLGSKDPGSEEQLYKAGRDAWDAFCDLCEPAPVKAAVPYGTTPLPVWFFRPDTSNTPRPTVILTNGSDGQNVDMWTYGVPAALERGWNALVYDGPGQGQLLFVDRVVFTPTWEKVVSPLVDWLSARPDVDQDRIALTGLSMAGDLAPRAAAFESRIAALVAMPGCVEPWLGFPPEIREILTPSKEETNDIWNTKVVPELPPEAAAVLKKRFEPFSIPAMLQARQGKLFTDFYTRHPYPGTLDRLRRQPDQGAHPRPGLRGRAVLPRPAAPVVRRAHLAQGLPEADRGPGRPAPLLPHGPAAALRGRLRLAPGDPAGRRLMNRVRPRRSAASR